MKRLILITFSIWLIPNTPWAGGPGTTSANFLKAGQGARPISMGETYIALGDGLDTLYWNPAGLIQIESPTASFMHSFWVQEIGTEYLAYGMPLGPLGAAGAGITILHGGAVEQTLEDEFGNYVGTSDIIHPLSLALIGTYAQKLSCLLPTGIPFLKNMLVGASLKIITESLSDVNVFGGGLDIGAIWRETEEIRLQNVVTAGNQGSVANSSFLVRDNGWRLGFVAQNLGVTTNKPMPINFRAGVGYVAQELLSVFGRGTVAADVLIPIDNNLKISLGAEYAHITQNTEAAVRLGYKLGNEINDLDALAGLTAGAGFVLHSGIFKYQIDYAIVPYGELGITHRVSLTVNFLSSKTMLRPDVEPSVSPPAKSKTASPPAVEPITKPMLEEQKESTEPNPAQPEPKL